MIRRVLLGLVVLLGLAAPAAAQSFSTNFETANSPCANCFGFDAVATPDLPSGSTITAMPGQGWNGTQAAKITIKGCTVGPCTKAAHQGNAGWFQNALGGIWVSGDTLWIKFRIKLLTGYGDAGAKFLLIGTPSAERINIRFDPLINTNAGCHPTGEGSNFYGVATPDTDPTNAWQTAAEFGLGSTFTALAAAAGGPSNYAGLYTGINITWNCAAFAVVPNSAAVSNIKPQNNAGITVNHWVNYQVGVTSGPAGTVDVRTYVNNNTLASPTSQCINCSIDLANSTLGVAGWAAGFTFGGFWGSASLTDISFLVDDFGIGPTFDSSFDSAVPAPTVTSASPSSGTTAGGTTVTLTGTGFVATPTVTFGGTACTSPHFTSSTQIECVSPAHVAGAVNIVVTNPDAQTGTLVSGYTYTSAGVTTRLPFRHDGGGL